MVQELQQRVAGGQYTVDPYAVAEAILSRSSGVAGVAGLCSEMLVAAKLPATRAANGDALALDDGA